MADDIQYNGRGLDQLIKAFKNIPTVRIGVMDAENSRPDGNKNAIIGKKHEYGEPPMPQRSFLRVPIQEHLQAKINESNLFKPEVVKKVLEEGSIEKWMNILGLIGVGIVNEAFQTSGYGQWPAWLTPGYTNRTGMLLLDTQNLRKSIGYEVAD